MGLNSNRNEKFKSFHGNKAVDVPITRIYVQNNFRILNPSIY